MFAAILGWAVLFLFASGFTAGSICSFIAQAVWPNSGGCWVIGIIFGLLAAAFWYAVYVNFPFFVGLNPAMLPAV